ncbi:hypothetical protein F0562_012084 [Nyssa sinensis]|uniref:Uncharacterized protein n=1 Tax=Nyssa sinensis TaxID=561372 RepID=A0A5J4ZU80_9ASTE|nr:hypothetical protein F0562_012084 [Nyssa sinensis]
MAVQERIWAELRAAVSEIERPWEVVGRALMLFFVNADEQLKVLADGFQQPGGFDLWSEKNGPQLFEIVDGADDRDLPIVSSSPSPKRFNQLS